MKVLHEVSKSHYGFNYDWYLFGDTDPITNGKLMHRKNKNCKLADVKQIRTHDFRHSCASSLISGSAPITDVSNFLGHSETTETLGTYTHMFKKILQMYQNSLTH